MSRFKHMGLDQFDLSLGIADKTMMGTFQAKTKAVQEIGSYQDFFEQVGVTYGSRIIRRMEKLKTCHAGWDSSTC